MRILVLGASGLIGHKLFQKLSVRFPGSMFGTLHGGRERFEWTGLFGGSNIVDKIDVLNFEAVQDVLVSVDPDVILNCVGITKRRAEIIEPVLAIGVNALFPHKLALWARDRNRRVIHFSTDCVFDGLIGDYTETSPTTGIDTYGKTKALGEIKYSHSLTIRSSFIGRELAAHSELLDWLLRQKGKVISGYTKALYSGVSTLEMARIVGDIIEYHTNLNGLYQLATERPISKFDLLCLARDAFEVDVEIVPDDSVDIKPTLNGSLLRSRIPLSLPAWPQMMRSLAGERGLYKGIS